MTLRIFPDRNTLHYVIANYRIRHWRAFMGIALLPILEILSSNLLNFLTLEFLLKCIIIVFAMSCFFAFAFSINNCFDIKEDILEGDESKNPIASRALSLRTAKVSSYGIAAIGLVFTLLLVGINELFLVYAMLMLMVWAYSAPPIRIKSKPFLDLIAHGLFFGSFLYAFSHSLLYNVPFLLALVSPVALLILFYSISLEIRNHYEDYDYDKEAGNKTTAILLGKRNSLLFLISVLTIAWIIMAYYSYTLISPYITAVYITVYILQFALYKKLEFKKWMRIHDIAVIFTLLLFTIA